MKPTNCIHSHHLRLLSNLRKLGNLIHQVVETGEERLAVGAQRGIVSVHHDLIEELVDRGLSVERRESISS